MVFAIDDYDTHEAIVFHQDRASGLKAIVGIHNTRLGPALGGCRMWPYGSEQEAVTDVIRLSKGMTYKAAISGLALGGGKSVIIGDPKTDKSPQLFRAMGRFIQSLGGRYLTAEDVGTTVEDLDFMREETPYARGTSGGSGNPSPATARGVYHGIRAAVRHRFGTDDLAGLRIAVQGLGNVGCVLADYLAKDGAKLIIADIDHDRIRRFTEQFGAEVASPEAVHGADVDVFAPCALGAGINDQTLPEIRASIIAGSANNQLATADHGQQLYRRGILYAPDYVINAGGLMDVAAEGPGYSEQAVLQQVCGIDQTLTEIFNRSEFQNVAPEVVADQMAEERFNGTTQAAA